VLVEVKVERLTLDRATQTPVVVLREEGGERVLPIWIGSQEASAIQMHLAGVSVGRPLTHDLLVSAIQAAGAELERVLVTRVQHNTYFAELHLNTGDGRVTLDARPSDSIAVALRTGAPIFAEDSLLDMVRVEIADGDEPSHPQEAPAPKEKPRRRTVGREPMSADELQEYLRKLNPEDFGRFNP